MLYILILFIGIIIGMLLITALNLDSKRKEEKQIFNEYKNLIDECFKETQNEKNGKKKEFK